MRYYEVSVRTWVSADFKALTQDGQLLWLFFLCGPIKTPLPGFYSVGMGACLDHLRWEPDRFKKAFKEIQDRDMLQFDDKNNVIYLPNWVYVDNLVTMVRHLDKSIQGIFDHWTALYGFSTDNIEDMDIDYDV